MISSAHKFVNQSLATCQLRYHFKEYKNPITETHFFVKKGGCEKDN